MCATVQIGTPSIPDLYKRMSLNIMVLNALLRLHQNDAESRFRIRNIILIA
jgi:hypothetical protein